MLFHTITEYIASGLEIIAVIFIAIGGIQTAWQTLWPWIHRKASHGVRRSAWLNFARWLLLGLEFTLAADIARTAIAPNWDSIGQLAAIAVIRTFLSYFLERDLEAEFKSEKQPLT